MHRETRKRRLLLLIDRLEDGGAERQFCELVRGLARRDRYELTVGILEERRGFYEWALEELELPIVRFGRAGRLQTKAIRSLARELARGRYDLIHASKPLACDYAVMAGRWCRVPLVLSSIRNAQDHDWKHYLRTRIHAWFADRLVANSQAGLDRRFRRPRDRFVVIRNGVDPARFEIDEERRARARAGLAIDAKSRLVVMAAAFSRKKDHATLIEAFARVAPSRPDVSLVLAGQGATRADVEARVAKLGLSGRVRFPGFVQDTEALLANAMLSVLLTDTRRHREGIANSLLESMALGVPVVATEGGGTNEVVEHGVSGILVPPFDVDAVAAALLRLLDDEAERRRLGENGRRRVAADFSLDRYVDDHVRLYEGVLRETSGSPR